MPAGEAEQHVPRHVRGAAGGGRSLLDDDAVFEVTPAQVSNDVL